MEEPQGQGWLQRQWQRVRAGRWRDVIIVQVDEGARNVAAGKYILQVNVGGRNLALPVIWIAVASALVVGGLAYWVAQPIFWPEPMAGTFNIAVTDFGVQGTDGEVRAGEQGALLSRWFFEQLSDAYGRHREEFAIVRDVELRHRSNAASPWDVTLGVIQGATAEERQAAAAKRAAAIGAHMVIYGHLADDGDGPGLDLEFYLAPISDQEEDGADGALPDERLAIVGPHQLGRALALPDPFSADNPDINSAVSDLLRTRADTLFWLTTGLAQDIRGRPEDALATLLRAKDELGDVPADAGRGLLDYFVGRQQLFLGQVEAAQASFEAAARDAPDYARAHIGLGSVEFRHAQDLSLRWAELGEEQRQSAFAHAEQAISSYRRAGEQALAGRDLLTHSVAQLALGSGYRLLGQLHTQAQQPAQARVAFSAADTYLDVAQRYFAGTTQYRLLAQVQEASGLVNYQLAAVLASLGEPGEQQRRLEKARTALDDCLELGRRTLRFVDEYTNSNVVEGSCRRWRDEVQAALAAAEGATP